MTRMLSRLFIISFLTLVLSGCLSIASTGAELAYNRNEISQSMANNNITYQAYQRVQKDPVLKDNANITMGSFNNVLLLTGQVKDWKTKQRAENLVKNVPGVKQVYNDLSIAPLSSGAQQTQDAWITTKIKTKIIATNGVTPGNFKVVTEDGVVYIMGAAPKDQVKKVLKLASHTDGVKKVVKMVYYVYYGTA